MTTVCLHVFETCQLFVYNLDPLCVSWTWTKCQTNRKFFPNVTIVPVLGNHDSYEPDNFTSKSAVCLHFLYSDLIFFRQ